MATLSWMIFWSLGESRQEILVSVPGRYCYSVLAWKEFGPEPSLNAIIELLKFVSGTDNTLDTSANKELCDIFIRHFYSDRVFVYLTTRAATGKQNNNEKSN